jgi:tetratricopeptide (TPR) repeat protein
MKNFLFLISVLLMIVSCGQTAVEYYNQGNAKRNLKDYIGAIADYTKAIELDPTFGHAYYNRGLLKNALSDTDGACMDWSKAGELGDSNAYELIKKHCN